MTTAMYCEGKKSSCPQRKPKDSMSTTYKKMATKHSAEGKESFI